MTLSITEIFKNIKQSTGHSISPIQTSYDRGWLIYSTKCQYCKSNITFSTENGFVYIDSVLVGRIILLQNNNIKFEEILKSQKEFMICKKLHSML